MLINLQSTEEKVILGCIQKGWGVGQRERNKDREKATERWGRRQNECCTVSIVFFFGEQMKDYLQII